MINIVNVVGSGTLNVEIDLVALASDFPGEAKYDPKKYPGAYLKLNSDSVLITLYSSGKYIVSGADSIEEAKAIKDRFISTMADMGVITSRNEIPFSIQNIVFTSKLGKNLNLNSLAIALGLERVEYEPEQFPGLIFRPTDVDATLLVFANGKIVLTGLSDVETAREVYMKFETEIEQYLE